MLVQHNALAGRLGRRDAAIEAAEHGAAAGRLRSNLYPSQPIRSQDLGNVGLGSCEVRDRQRSGVVGSVVRMRRNRQEVRTAAGSRRGRGGRLGLLKLIREVSADADPRHGSWPTADRQRLRCSARLQPRRLARFGSSPPTTTPLGRVVQERR